jgi:hypothetical protein
MKKRLGRSLRALSEWCQKRRHDDVESQWKSLTAKMRGHYEYYGRATNFRSLLQFYRVVRCLWRKWLNRCTRGSPDMERLSALADALPAATSTDRASVGPFSELGLTNPLR